MVVPQPRYNPATIPLLAIIFWASSYNVLCRPVQCFEPAQKVERGHVTTCYTGTLTRSHGLSLPQSGPLQRLKWPYYPSFVTHSGAFKRPRFSTIIRCPCPRGCWLSWQHHRCQSRHCRSGRLPKRGTRRWVCSPGSWRYTQHHQCQSRHCRSRRP